MDKMAKEETKKPELEREYIIPLRRKCRVVPRYKKANKAVKTVKEFLVKHMKIRDRDLKKVKLSTYVNEFLWNRGIRHPPHKIKVKAIKEGDIVRVELVDMPKKLEQKRNREEKLQKIFSEAVQKKKAVAKPEEAKKEENKEENKAIEIEKKSAVVEAGAKLEKTAAKQMKHLAKKQETVSTIQKKSLQR
ncbi:MAG TPA: 50S ribosomal protein L31e [Candidatus Nanoarchaeia archaeon]|nr:50S ribosomal protein L31e [Candidatus Nanoarchaeia archaeon]